MKGPMTPLQKIAMGLVIVVLHTGGSYDLYPDFIGWGIVMWGLLRFPGAMRNTLLLVAGAAAVLGAVLWFPAAHDALADADPALQWVADLPRLVFAFLLCRTLMNLAGPTDPKAVRIFGTLSVLWVVLIALPAVAYAANSSELVAGFGQLGLLVATVWLIWMLFSRNSRDYATAPEMS